MPAGPGPRTRYRRVSCSFARGGVDPTAGLDRCIRSGRARSERGEGGFVGDASVEFEARGVRRAGAWRRASAGPALRADRARGRDAGVPLDCAPSSVPREAEPRAPLGFAAQMLPDGDREDLRQGLEVGFAVLQCRSRRVAEVGILATGLGEGLRRLAFLGVDLVERREVAAHRVAHHARRRGHHQRRLPGSGVVALSTEKPSPCRSKSSSAIIRKPPKSPKTGSPPLKTWPRRAAELALATPPTAIRRCFHLATLEVALVDDATSDRVHRDFMDIEGPTDVITFHHGEIVIGAEVAAAPGRRIRRTARPRNPALPRPRPAPSRRP